MVLIRIKYLTKLSVQSYSWFQKIENSVHFCTENSVYSSVKAQKLSSYIKLSSPFPSHSHKVNFLFGAGWQRTDEKT